MSNLALNQAHVLPQSLSLDNNHWCTYTVKPDKLSQLDKIKATCCLDLIKLTELVLIKLTQLESAKLTTLVSIELSQLNDF